MTPPRPAVAIAGHATATHWICAALEAGEGSDRALP